MTKPSGFGRRDRATSARVAGKVLDGSPADKLGMAGQMGQLLDAGLSEEERSAAEEMVRALCDDIVETVRIALAKSVASSPHLPGYLAERLALDIESVSIPVLEYSTVLGDDVLMEVIGKAGPGQLEATARRSVVSEAVSDAIVERGHVPAVSMLVANRGAEMSSDTWEKVIERHGDDADVVQAAEERGGIPEPVAAKLTNLAKAHVRSFVIRHFNVLPTALPSLDDVRIEVAAGRSVTPVVPEGTEPGAYAERLNREGGLHHGLLLQAVCAGEFRFVMAAIAQITGLSFIEVQNQLFSSSPTRCRALLESAGLEPAVAEVVRSLLGKGHFGDRAEYQRVALETVSAAAGRDVAAMDAA